MKHVFIFCSLFLLANSSVEETIELEAYIANLVDSGVIGELELHSFVKHLDRNELVNPIDCKKRHCSAIQLIHHETLEEHISQNINKTEILNGLHEFLRKRAYARKRREETKKVILDPWKQSQHLLSTGYDFACAVNKERKPVCWGKKFQTFEAPKDLGLSKSIAVGNSHFCVLTEYGAVDCFHSANKRTSIHSPSSRFVALDINGDETCLLEENGKARCWYSMQTTRNTAPQNSNFLTQISVGVFHTQALDDRGMVLSWGMPRKAAPPNFGPFIQVAVGESHICGLEERGTVRCVGGSIEESTVPQNLGVVTQISSGDYCTCILETMGTAKCWGSIPEEIQTKLLRLGPVLQISAGHHQVCVVKKNKKLECFNWLSAPQLNPPEELEIYLEEN